MKFRRNMTILTLVLLALVVYFARHKLALAWNLLGKVDIWILALMIPVQVFSYYASGNIMFSYLKGKGHLDHLTRWQTARFALEFNFVNHILPSGGAVGFSYLIYALHRHGVSIARATMAQVIRHVLMFVTFILLLVSSVIFLAIDSHVSRYVVTSTIILSIAALGLSGGIIYIMEKSSRMHKFATKLRNAINAITRLFTRGRENNLVKKTSIEKFFEEIHQDYVSIRHDKKIMMAPLLWSLVTNILDVSLLYIGFLALGVAVNPALLFIAFGVSSVASVLTVSPGGAGVYEAVMIGFLASAGVDHEVAIAGTLLSRVILLTGTILFGYVFYQMTINQYGKDNIIGK